MPWSVCWKLFNWLARNSWLFRTETDNNLSEARAAGFVECAQDWQVRQRLTRMVDLVDAALSFARSDRWLAQHVRVEGDIPQGACMMLGFHFGAGFWVLRHQRKMGHRISFLSRRITSEEFPGQPICFAFERWRMLQVERAGGAPVIYVGGSVAKMQNALSAGISVLGMVDVPPEGNRTEQIVRFLGERASFPDGLLRLAKTERVPIAMYSCSLDPISGDRLLSYRIVPDTESDPLAWVVRQLELAIHEDSASWHLWSQWRRFYDGAQR